MLNLDFTFVKYKELCEAIVESKYATLTFTHYFWYENTFLFSCSWVSPRVMKVSLKNIPEKFIILRHDVDRRPENALEMAVLERELGSYVKDEEHR